jgi:hypothetical protein
MKKILLAIGAAFVIQPAFSQISITASDMPISGDTLSYSVANNTSITFNIADSGASKAWNYSLLSPISQGVDTFKTASAVNITYALTISPTAYGYKVADSLPGLSSVLPISVNNLYTFFNKKTSPNRYVAEGFAAVISGIPTPVNYTDEDEWYYFPLNYLRSDSSTYALSFSLPTIGSIKQKGYRKTRVDGWGTITTPYYSTPVNCIRVRSEIHEIDSIDLIISKIGIPRNTVEYKFLANGEHYPVLWVTTNITGTTETVSNMRYRDSTRKGLLSIAGIAQTYHVLKAYPNPVGNHLLNIEVPVGWNNYQIDLFDVQGKQIGSYSNNNHLDLNSFPSGQYVLRVSSRNEIGYTTFIK